MNNVIYVGKLKDYDLEYGILFVEDAKTQEIFTFVCNDNLMNKISENIDKMYNATIGIKGHLVNRYQEMSVEVDKLSYLQSNSK